jgi:hypothetical protein
MKKVLAALSTAVLLGFAGSALAEEASGKITSVDPASRMIQLEDGTSFTVSEGVAIESLQPGTEVTVSYEEQDGKNVATEVVPTQ